MPAEANPPAKPEGYMEQAKEALAQIISEIGLMIRPPSHKRDTLLAHIGAKIAREQGRFEAYHQRVFEAVWKNEEDIGDPLTLSQIAGEAGMDPSAFQQSLKEERYREMVEADFKHAVDNRIWTIPSYMGRKGTIQVDHFKDIPSQEDLYEIL